MYAILCKEKDLQFIMIVVVLLMVVLVLVYGCNLSFF